MHKTIVCSMLLALLATGPLRAAEPFDPAARAKVVAPYIGETTFAVVHADASRVDVPALLGKIVELVPETEEVKTEITMALSMALGAFRAAGGTDAYAVISADDFDFHKEPMIPLIFPLAKETNEQTLLALLSALPYEVKQRRGDVLLLCSRKSLRRFESGKPDPRPELVKAFEAAGDTAAQAIYIPPAYFRRVIEEMMPILPEEIGGGSSRAITDGALWAAASLELPPKTGLNLVVQSRDAEAADAFRKLWIEGLGLAGRDKEVQRNLPNFEQITAMLTPEVQADRVTLSITDDNGRVAKLAASLVAPALAGRNRAVAMNNLKQIALALLNHESAHKAFPTQAICDEDGKPLLSWRVKILPYIDAGDLYKQFHLDEPWDSEHNRKLIDKMPDVYRSPTFKPGQAGLTHYLVPLSKEGIIREGESLGISGVKDGTAHTILVVEVDDAHAVPWTKPADLAYDPDKPAAGLGGHFEGGFLTVFCDGSVHFISDEVEAKSLRALFTAAGGEPMPDLSKQ